MFQRLENMVLIFAWLRIIDIIAAASLFSCLLLEILYSSILLMTFELFLPLHQNQFANQLIQG